MKKYPDGHFELVVVEFTAEDGAFNNAVKGPYQLFNTRRNTDICYIFSIIEEIVDPTVNSTLPFLLLAAIQPIYMSGIPNRRPARMRDLPIEEVEGEISGKWERMAERYNVDDQDLHTTAHSLRFWYPKMF